MPLTTTMDNRFSDRAGSEKGDGGDQRNMSGSGNWMTVAKRDAVALGGVVGVKAGNLDVALYNIDGQIYATHNICTHAHAYLSEGWLEGDIIECPLHGGRFEAKTGKGSGAPITCDIKTLLVRVEGDVIQVNVS
jgi:nitrite reductase/ring-hydroxylating ferredoxin subunit